MVERGQGGAIVNISSMTTNVAFPEHTSYCSSKGAVDTLTRVMALELGPHQVRILINLTKQHGLPMNKRIMYFSQIGMLLVLAHLYRILR